MDAPLAYNGKPDRKKLASYEIIPNNNILKPKDGLVKKILQIVSEVLKEKNITIEDNYYYLGGNSVTGMQIISQLYHILGVELNIYDILSRPNIKDWIPLIKKELDSQEYRDVKKIEIIDICRSFFKNNEITEDMSFDEMGGNENNISMFANEIGLTEFQILSLPWIDCWDKMLQ